MLVLLMACDSQPKSSVEVNDNDGEDSLVAAKESTLRQKEEYREAIANKLQDLSVKITALKTKAAAMSGEAKTDFDDGVNALEAKAQDLRKRLTDLKTASAKQWETMREDIEARLKILEDSFAQVAAKFLA
jgi:hypothetical protein